MIDTAHLETVRGIINHLRKDYTRYLAGIFVSGMC